MVVGTRPDTRVAVPIRPALRPSHHRKLTPSPGPEARTSEIMAYIRDVHEIDREPLPKAPASERLKTALEVLKRAWAKVKAKLRA